MTGPSGLVDGPRDVRRGALEQAGVAPAAEEENMRSGLPGDALAIHD